MQTMSVVQVYKNRSPGCVVHGKVWIHGIGMGMDSHELPKHSPGTGPCPQVFCPYVRAGWGISGGKGCDLGGLVDFFNSSQYM